MKISDEVPRDDLATVNAVAWTAGLDAVFKENAVDDRLLRFLTFPEYQYIY